MDDRQCAHVDDETAVRGTREWLRDISALLTALAGLVAAVTTLIVALTASR